MAVLAKETRRINVTFPVQVLELLEDVLPARQRNRFIVEATEQALQRAQLARVLEALRESPAWKDEDHPGLATVDGVNNYVRTLRDNWMSAEPDSPVASSIPNA